MFSNKLKGSLPILAAVGLLASTCLPYAALAADESAISTGTTTTELWRKDSPALPPPRPFVMPAIDSYKLDNGLTVQLLEDHRVPFITAELGIKAGSSRDPKDMLGLAGITADMITEGTATKKSKEIAQEVDYIGGGLHAAADADFTLLVGSSLSKYTDRLFNIMSDVVLNPSFPQDELKLNKTNLLQELIMKRSEPDFLVNESFSKQVFGDHPYAIIAPKPETVQRITQKDLEDFHAKYYVPNEAILIVVGDFDKAAMKDKIAAAFGDKWKSGTVETAEMPAAPKQEGVHIYLIDRPGSVQSSIKIGNIAIKKSDPDFFPLLVTNQILGGAAHSRLFVNIREEKGYTYGAYSSFAARKDPGAFAATAEVRTDVTSPSLQEFFYELERIRNVKASDKELQDAKMYLAGSFQLGLETQAGLAQRLLEVQLYDLPADYLATYADKVMAVTPDDVRRVARKDIDANDFVISVVGDANKIKSDLEYFAPVQVFDTSGNLVKGTASSSKPGA
jgi:predicted Zn-dependent peptidase